MDFHGNPDKKICIIYFVIYKESSAFNCWMNNAIFRKVVIDIYTWLFLFCLQDQQKSPTVLSHNIPQRF